MRKFVFILVTALLFPAPAFAWVDAVFQCQPDGFALRRDGEGFALYGALDTVQAGYSYDIAPVTGNGDGNGETTLTLVPPEGGYAPRPSHVMLNQSFVSVAWPVSHLVIRVQGDSRYPGPGKIECWQRGGGQ